MADVVADGATYFAVSGNNNIVVDGQNVGSYEAPAFRPAPCPIANIGTSCHDFDPGTGIDVTQEISLDSGASVSAILQWAEPWYGVETDLDIYLLDADNNIIVRGADANTGSFGTQQPFEFLPDAQNVSGLPQPASIVIARSEGTGVPRIKYVFNQTTQLHSIEYNTSNGDDTIGPTIRGHAAAQEAITVAAVPYYDSTVPQDFTGHGPIKRYFGPVVDTAPAEPLLLAEVRQKPDIAATNGVRNTFFSALAPDGFYRFFGTSAASPHAAAVAALLLEANSSLSPDEVRTAMVGTAIDIAPQGVDTITGYGLVQADAAVEWILSGSSNITVRADETTRRGGPGETITHAFDIENSGSSEDTFDIAITGAKWTTTLVGSPIRVVQAGARATVEVQVTIPQDVAIDDRDTVLITVVSQRDAEVQESIILTTNAFDIGFDTQSISVAQEDIAEYTLTITNTGTVSETFIVQLTDYRWPTALTTTLQLAAGTYILNQTDDALTVSVAPGSRSMVAVVVDIPPDAVTTTPDTAIVDVSLERMPGRSRSFALTTSASQMTVYLPLVTR